MIRFPRDLDLEMQPPIDLLDRPPAAPASRHRVYVVEDDELASAHLQYDRLDLLRQLDEVPTRFEG